MSRSFVNRVFGLDLAKPSIIQRLAWVLFSLAPLFAFVMALYAIAVLHAWKP